LHLAKEVVASCTTEVEFRESLIQQLRIRITAFRQAICPATQDIEHTRNVVFGDTTGVEKDLDTCAQM
jgi:hypothetical protein